MKLSKLFVNLKNYKVIGNKNINIQNLSNSSKQKAQNTAFFCIDGTKTNGIIYLNEAIKNGVICAILSLKYHNSLQINQNITYVFVDDVRKAMAVMSANFYNNPQNKLKVIGITGTNGKTSCSYIIANLLKGFGKKVGVIGTSGIFIDSQKFEANMTTPDSIELFEIFSKMVNAKCEYCVMEVSAHAIYYKKIYGIKFAVKALTNVKSDHLDFFKTWQNYANVKQSFFKSRDKCVLNIDDKIGEKIAKKCKKTLNFGKKYAIFSIFNKKTAIGSTTFCVKYKDNKYIIKTNLTGSFNIYNLSLSICVAMQLGFKICDILPIVKTLNCVSGRLDLVYQNKNFNIIIDYAHTFDSLKNLLRTVKNISTNNNIIVFGCPGERDTQKRFLMGKLAGMFCDVVFFTSDNPASENPLRIIFEMEQGFLSIQKRYKTLPKFYVIEKRTKAIKKAIILAKKLKSYNVLIVGKGTEKYQIIGDKKIAYSDYDAVNNILCKMNFK